MTTTEVTARVSGDARISGDRHVVTLGPVGSENRYVTCHRTVDGHLVVAGCWQGTLDELAERIAAPASAWGHGSDDDRARWAADYEQAIEFLRPRVAEWDQHKREEMTK